jgi:hypothetical protein
VPPGLSKLTPVQEKNKTLLQDVIDLMLDSTPTERIVYNDRFVAGALELRAVMGQPMPWEVTPDREPDDAEEGLQW